MPPVRPARVVPTRHTARVCRVVAAASVVAVAACGVGDGTATPRTKARAVPFVLGGVTGVTEVAQLTGPGSVNRTDRVHVAGQDLGSMFDAEGRTWFVFGDTFGRRDPGMTGGGGEDWRSNALAWTTDTDPTDGITFGGYVTDERGWAKELIPGKKVDHDEMTVIPTYGFAASGAMYLHFMSVRHWGTPGEWEANYAGLAKSTDHGRSWAVLDRPRWPGDGNFVQVSVVALDGELWSWGVTHGRFGGVQLMKVPEGAVEDPNAYRYFTGVRDDEPQWGTDPAAAQTVVDGTVGELSVVWNDYLDRWLMSSTDGVAESATLREGVTPWGPWSDPVTLLSQEDLPGVYAPYLHPRFVGDGGKRVYFCVSQWDPYQVFWYRADLVRKD